MQRRKFVNALGATVAGASLAACSGQQDCGEGKAATSDKVYKWKMVTTWPKNFQALGEGANYLAELITKMTGGRIQVHVYGSGEIVPAFEVFDTVSRGTAELGHGSAYYWKGKIPVSPFFSTVPFGLTAQEMNAWLLKGGGLELWQELYKPHNVVPMPVGNSTVQMAGWFNKEINSIEDLKGLKMRIPGLGGEILKRVGGTPVLLSGGEIFTSLESGAIDAVEWVGPYNDLSFGLYKAAKYYYYPGWHEPGTTMECLINAEALASLPQDLQEIVKSACLIANQDMISDFTAKNNQGLKALVEQHGVQVKRLPDDVLRELKAVAEEVAKELAAESPFAQKVYDSYMTFKRDALAWAELSELAIMEARKL